MWKFLFWPRAHMLDTINVTFLWHRMEILVYHWFSDCRRQRTPYSDMFLFTQIDNTCITTGWVLPLSTLRLLNLVSHRWYRRGEGTAEHHSAPKDMVQNHHRLNEKRSCVFFVPNKMASYGLHGYLVINLHSSFQNSAFDWLETVALSAGCFAVEESLRSTTAFSNAFWRLPECPSKWSRSIAGIVQSSACQRLWRNPSALLAGFLSTVSTNT